jgi:hypothetical protein
MTWVEGLRDEVSGRGRNPDDFKAAAKAPSLGQRQNRACAHAPVLPLGMRPMAATLRPPIEVR